MISRRLPAWQKVVAFAPLLLVLVSLPGQVLLRCRVDGLLRSACCCPQGQDAPASTPVIKAQDCCERQVIVNARLPVDASRVAAADGILPAKVLAGTVSLVAFAADPRTVQVRSHGPPREGPSVVLLKHAFLI